MAKKRILLIFPPASSARFFPYLSLPQLTAYLRNQGHDVHQVDLNIELTHFLTLPSQATAFADEFLNSRGSNKALKYISGEVRTYCEALQKCRHYIFDDETKRLSPRTDSAQYILSRISDMQLEHYGYMENYSNYTALPERISQRQKNPVYDWLEDRAASLIDKHQPDIVLLSVPFFSQLAASLELAQHIKNLSPKTHISLGGAILQAHGEGLSRQPQLFKNVDSLVYGAGEPALGQILSGVTKGPNESPIKLNNKVNMRGLAIPDWSGLPLKSYLNPEFHLGLTSCFGCWWGRCVFCSYGNQSLSPETPYQEKSREQLKNEMRHIVEKYNPRQINITDEESNLPILVEAFDALKNEGVSMVWNARYRLGKRLTKADYCQKLAELGCNIIFAGFESTSQSTLDRLNRGINAADYDLVLDNLEQVGILPRISLTLGFPGETREQAEETCSYLKDNFYRIGLDGVQQMVPEPTSLIGSQPVAHDMELSGTDELFSNPKTNYAGGRYGYAPKQERDVQDLLEDMDKSWSNHSKEKERHKRQKDIETCADIRQLKPVIGLGTGLLEQNGSGQTWANFLQASEVDLPHELEPILRNADGDKTLPELAASSGHSKETTTDVVIQLYIDNFIDLYS